MHIQSFLAAASSALMVALQCAPVLAGGSFKLAPARGAPLTIEYTTDQPNDKNWIGLWRAGDGPVDQKKPTPGSLVWKYTPGRSGKINLPTPGIPAGKHWLFFLVNDGYEWVSGPIDYSKPGGMRLIEDGADPVTIEFSTMLHQQTNWLGLYRASGGGPVNEEKDQGSLTWAYTNGAVSTANGVTTGRLRLATRDLDPGAYKVFYLAVDGYRWMTDPIDVSVDGRVQSVSGEPLTFRYTTNKPNSKNWIGLYKPGDGPSGGSRNGNKESVKWEYVTGSSGTVTLSTDDVPSGNYQVYFCANDGYKWLGEYIEISYTAPNTPLRFYAGSMTTHNARIGSRFSYTARGLLEGGTSGVTFSRADGGSGSSWLSVSADGVVSGTPPAGSPSTWVQMRATKESSSATIRLVVPVRPSGSALVGNLRVMTLNMWHGGTRIKNHLAKEVSFIASSNVDIIGFQEVNNGGTNHAKRIADALGWHSRTDHGKVAIISRYRIAENYDSSTSTATGVRVQFDDGAVNVWVAHLGYNPYGPYDFCFDKMSVDRVLQREAQSGRTGEITDALNSMKGLGHIADADNVPVLLMGDFNAPSHLDWTDALKSKNCGYSDVPWPSSVRPTEAGLIDSFRIANPDPVAVQGITWSPVNPKNDNGKAEPQDRIDFIYHKGRKLRVSSSRTVLVGQPKPVSDPSYVNNEWTSDHAAVITEYELRA
ncbi:hypothetical protein GGTG_13221 [Gaeumannomyces tritici R3-111a-1]|uniref:Endonuclease/exonuclease/phosphatase domain-containing protein n=1 Tax=Gaeumannomyces tritici (strain R3-111a-1) TaxID=644352 RepID=J3PI93_GAET3|nr:hypothetical protein GGTG_13221 [Gaeumannomyces tritici R3-111a-1]EJT69605.1 hypothetical protein GGTG_13221 [Gaeumannomyces tritici R3-111a-1]